MRKLIAVFILFTFAFTSLIPVSFAHDGFVNGGRNGDPPPPPPGNDPPPSCDNPNGCPDDPRNPSDPVLLSTGDYQMRVRDYYLPGRGLDIEIMRIYRSRSYYNGPMGYGWDFNYNMRLRKLANGNVLITTGENRFDIFTKAGSLFTPPSGNHQTLNQNQDGSFTLAEKNGLLYQFDQSGRLTSMVDRNGNTITFTYDPAGKLPIVGPSKYFVSQTEGILAMDYRLIQITDTVGRKIDFFYDTKGRIKKIKDFDGRILTYGYSADGDLTHFGFVPPEGLGPGEKLMGYQRIYSYKDHNLETITDAKGKIYLQNFYDDKDRVKEQIYGDPAESGGKATFTYNEATRTTTAIDRKGFKTVWTYDAKLNPVKFEAMTHGIRTGDPAKFVTEYGYNSNFERTQIKYPKGNIIDFKYNDAGDLEEIRKKGQNGNADIVSAFTYEPKYHFIKTVTDPRGNTTTFFYDYELGEPQKGNLRKIIFPSVDGEVIERVFTYNAFGQVDTDKDPNGNITKYEYYPDTGYIKKVTRGFGTEQASTIEGTYDPAGNTKDFKDGRGFISTFIWDVNNKLKEYHSPTPFNFLTRFTYDVNGMLEKEERQSNAAGDQFQTLDYTYTALDQLKTITDDLNQITEFQYDANGNRKKIIDAEGKVTEFIFDERNLIFTVKDAKNAVTTYGYDGNENLKTIKDANNNVTTYEYDEFDRVRETKYADQSKESYTFDAASNLKTRTSAKSEVTIYDYDELNRLTFKTYQNCAVEVCGGNVDYDYDPGSRLETISNQNAAYTYQYDSLNRVEAVDSTLFATHYALAYGYDQASNRNKLTYPHGRVIQYAYDQMNRLDLIKNQAGGTLFDFNYDELSRRKTLARPNGVTTTYGYDVINQIKSIQHGALTTIGYPLYDKVGNIKRRTDAQGTHNYGYNNIYELTSATTPSASYNYDAVGNRLTASAANTPASYTPNNLNQYSAVDGVTYQYDLNGNLKNDGTNQYAYDFENRLVSVIPAQAGIQHSYAYDPFGRRIRKTVDSIADSRSTLHYLYDSDDILEIYDCSLSPVSCPLSRSFLHGPGIDEPLEMVTHPSETKYYYHQDHLGSVIRLSNSSGTSQETTNYSVYGTPSAVSALNNPYLFTGREYDSESGLYFYRARTYSPKLGRFLQRDPLGTRFQAHLFRYVQNDPVNYQDPLGLFRFGKRPLKGFGEKFWGFLDKQNAEAAHEHGFFEDNKSGEIDNIGYGPDGFCFFACTGSKRFYDENINDYDLDDTYYDDDIMREAYKRLNDNSYCLLGSNCQNWADKLRDMYEKIKKEREEKEKK